MTWSRSLRPLYCSYIRYLIFFPALARCLCLIRHIEKQHWDWTITMNRGGGGGGGGAWDKAPTVREIDKLDDITYFGKFSKLGWKKKTLLRLSNSWYQQQQKNSWWLCLIISDIRNMISTNHVSKLKELQICNQNCVYKLSFCLPQDKTEPTS